MCAITTVRHDKELKAYYERKVKEGKNKMPVINNVRCKLLARVFAVINRNPENEYCIFRQTYNQATGAQDKSYRRGVSVVNQLTD